MARQPDYTGTLINLGIFAGVIIAAIFLFKWVKTRLADGGSIFGAGNAAGSGLAAGSMATQAAPGVAPWNMNTQPQHMTVGERLAVAHRQDFIPTKIQRIGYELSAANLQAKKYEYKAGSNVIINRALKHLNELPDHDFMAAIQEWQKLDQFHNFYETPLVSAKINAASHSTFISHYNHIAGVVSNGISKALAMTHLGVGL